MICSKPCGDMADVLLSLKHTVPTPQSSVGEQQQHDQVYGLSANHNVSIHDYTMYYMIQCSREINKIKRKNTFLKHLQVQISIWNTTWLFFFLYFSLILERLPISDIVRYLNLFSSVGGRLTNATILFLWLLLNYFKVSPTFSDQRLLKNSCLF